MGTPEAQEPPDLGQPKARKLEDSPRYFWQLFRTAVDYVALNTDAGRDMMLKANPYPDPFVFSHLEAHAGAELGCWVGMRKERAPLVIFVPGTFATKDVASTRARTLRIFADTKAHACALDLRGFGHSNGTRSTAGYLEAYDIAHITRDFAQDPRVSGVIVVGESLGGAAALIAASHRPEGLAGVLAINPFADLDWIVRFISTHPPRWHAYHLVYHAFNTMLRRVTGRKDERFDGYVQKVAAGLGMSMHELSFRTSPRFHLHEVQVPTLVLHATDDPLVPAFHAHVLRQAGEGNPNVRVHLTLSGGHTYFELVDEGWYWETVLGFLREAGA